MKPGWQSMKKGGAEHIRSHQLDDSPEILLSVGQDERHRLLGNQLADTKADEGQTFHPPLDKEMLVLDQLAFNAAQAVVELAARILPLHPRRPRISDDNHHLHPTPLTHTQVMKVQLQGPRALTKPPRVDVTVIWTKETDVGNCCRTCFPPVKA